jgi:general secretion pathway protein J
MTPGADNQKGVSLLEALIAVALLAGLAVLLTPALVGAMRASNSVLERAANREDNRIVEDALVQILDNSVVMDASDPDLRIGGDESLLRVISLAGANEARRFTLRIENGALTGAIAPLIDDGAPAQTTQILGAGALEFSYYGRQAEDAPLNWSRKWDSASPPQIIRLETAAKEEGGGNIIHEIHIAARSPLHCAFDTVSRRCRN